MLPVGVETLQPALDHDDDVRALVIRSEDHIPGLEILGEAVEGHPLSVVFIQFVEEWKI